MRTILSIIRVLIILLIGIVVGGALMFGYMNFRTSAIASSLTPVAQALNRATSQDNPSNPPSSSSSGTFLSEDTVTKVYEKTSQGVVEITSTINSGGSGAAPQGGTGTGIVLDKQGNILTNNHVIEGAQKVQVTLVDGTNYDATIVGRDRGNDLAIVKINISADKLQPLELGDSSNLKVGQPVIAIGTPFSLDQTVTFGIISSLGRNYSADSGRTIRDVIQTDAAINPGNSGGPLLNTAGQVIGINTAIESPVRGSVGVGFAVPVNTVKTAVPQMVQGTEVKHPWLGISGIALNETVAQGLGLSVNQGVYVVQVVDGSPAAKAGLHGSGADASHSTSGEMPKGGDVILSVDNQKVTKVEEISSYLETKNIGDKVTLTVLRDGQTQKIDVTTAEWPENLTPQN